MTNAAVSLAFDLLCLALSAGIIGSALAVILSGLLCAAGSCFPGGSFLFCLALFETGIISLGHYFLLYFFIV